LDVETQLTTDPYLNAGTYSTYYGRLSITMPWEAGIPHANQLTALTVSTGTLSPSLRSDVDTYTVRVDQRVAGIQIGGKTEVPNATITIAGQTISNGGNSSVITLKPGKNLINVVVTSVDGASRTYAVIVLRGGY
jgi:hypothetical protein